MIAQISNAGKRCLRGRLFIRGTAHTSAASREEHETSSNKALFFHGSLCPSGQALNSALSFASWTAVASRAGFLAAKPYAQYFWSQKVVPNITFHLKSHRSPRRNTPAIATVEVMLHIRIQSQKRHINDAFVSTWNWQDHPYWLTITWSGSAWRRSQMVRCLSEAWWTSVKLEISFKLFLPHLSQSSVLCPGWTDFSNSFSWHLSYCISTDFFNSQEKFLFEAHV